MKFFLILLPTVLLTSYGQIVTKWRVNHLSPGEGATALERLFVYLTDPYIISAYVFSFLSSVAWIYVVEKYPVSMAFPAYVGIVFSIVLLASALLLRETVTLQHVAGIALIMAGVYVASHA